MKVVNKKMCVIIILMLVIIESCTLFLMYKSYSAKETKLDEVNLQEVNSNMFAIMLEQDDGTYKEDTSNTWPTSGYAYNASMSGCIDSNGNKIDGALTYDATNNIAIVDTGSTSYCYLYFSLPPDNLYKLCKSYNNIDECIKNESSNISYITDIWESTLEDDGYRYTGTNPNNYMCFGTTDKDTCTGNTDMYMYRVIGIFEDEGGNEHLKLIKKEALNTSYVWHSDYTDVDWDESDLYKGINGSYFLTNTTYNYMQDTTWTDKIVEWNYTATNTLTDENYSTTGTTYGVHYSNNTPKSIYLHELNRSTKTDQICYYGTYTTADCSVGEWKEVPAKIGLMYVSDYASSLGDINADLYDIDFSSSWIHIINNDSTPPISSDYSSSLEWTMSRYGMASFAELYMVYTPGADGIATNMVLYEVPARPVFYLTSDVEITGGTGTSTDPYIIG